MKMLAGQAGRWRRRQPGGERDNEYSASLPHALACEGHSSVTGDDTRRAVAQATADGSTTATAIS
jgi:hypothetical protein